VTSRHVVSSALEATFRSGSSPDSYPTPIVPGSLQAFASHSRKRKRHFAPRGAQIGPASASMRRVRLDGRSRRLPFSSTSGSDACAEGNDPMNARSYLTLALFTLAGCDRELPPRGQLVLYVDTDAIVAEPSRSDDTVLSPLIDRARFEILVDGTAVPGAT